MIHSQVKHVIMYMIFWKIVLGKNLKTSMLPGLYIASLDIVYQKNICISMILNVSV